jgi:hypothetical protein
MQDIRGTQLDRRQASSQPRRFVYRSTHPQQQLAHPMRRNTDIPLPFQPRTAQPLLLEMRAYFKLN